MNDGAKYRRYLTGAKEFIMLDLVFLVLMIAVLLKSLKGDFNLTLCSVATVVGVIAAIVGIITAFFSNEANSYGLGFLNILVLIIAFLLKPAAKHFAKLYQNKIDEETRSYFEAEQHAKDNFFRKAASENAYMHAAERGTNPPDANMHTNGAFPQGNNDGMANNQAFLQTGSSAASPTAANNAVFPQNANPAASPMAASNADSPKMEGISPLPRTAAAQPTDLGADNNYGLPYDLSAPINLDRGIDDDISDKNK